MNGFVPKKPVKSFMDLEVYQKALECAVFVAKYVVRSGAERPSAEVESRPFGLVPPESFASSDNGLAEPKVQTRHAATSGNVGSGTAQCRNCNRPFGLVPIEAACFRESRDSVVGCKRDLLRTAGNFGSGTATDLIFHNMLPCALGLPHLIAEAHSVRFGGKKDCLILLERAMLNCNKMAVYLEETRDIADTGVPTDKFNELIKKYLYIRQKILNLQRSWKKYMNES